MICTILYSTPELAALLDIYLGDSSEFYRIGYVLHAAAYYTRYEQIHTSAVISVAVRSQVMPFRLAQE